MGTVELRSLEGIQSLIAAVYKSNEPVIVLDGEDECLVAMCPSTLERLLFDTQLLNTADREALHY